MSPRYLRRILSDTQGVLHFLLSFCWETAIAPRFPHAVVSGSPLRLSIYCFQHDTNRLLPEREDHRLPLPSALPGPLEPQAVLSLKTALWDSHTNVVRATSLKQRWHSPFPLPTPAHPSTPKHSVSSSFIMCLINRRDTWRMGETHAGRVSTVRLYSVTATGGTLPDHQRSEHLQLFNTVAFSSLSQAYTC